MRDKTDSTCVLAVGMNNSRFSAYSNHIFAETDGGNMQEKLPYYMVYPMPFAYDDGRVDERDIEYMKSLYPDVAKRILPYIEEECDRMEYQNSMMYDEYPDRLQLRMMCSRVCDKVRQNEKIFFGTGYEEIVNENEINPAEQEVSGQQRRPQHQKRPDRMRDLIEILLYQELMRRRRENRRHRGRNGGMFY